MNATMMDSDKNGWGQRSHVLREEEESMSDDVFLDDKNINIEENQARSQYPGRWDHEEQCTEYTTVRTSQKSLVG